MIRRAGLAKVLQADAVLMASLGLLRTYVSFRLRERTFISCPNRFRCTCAVRKSAKFSANGERSWR
jgi:hypothetical protein